MEQSAAALRHSNVYQRGDEVSSLLMPIMNGITLAHCSFLCQRLHFSLGLMRVVNMSYGMLYLLGSYVGLSIQRPRELILAIVGGAVAVALLTGVLELFLLRRVQGDPLRETLLTLGVSYIIGDLLLAFYGGIPKLITAPTYVRRAVNLGLMKYPGTRLFMLGTAVVIGIGLWLLMSKTRIGQIIRAGVDDKEMVSALGININRVFCFVFIIAGLLWGSVG